MRSIQKLIPRLKRGKRVHINRWKRVGNYANTVRVWAIERADGVFGDPAACFRVVVALPEIDQPCFRIAAFTGKHPWVVYCGGIDLRGFWREDSGFAEGRVAIGFSHFARVGSEEAAYIAALVVDGGVEMIIQFQGYCGADFGRLIASHGSDTKDAQGGDVALIVDDAYFLLAVIEVAVEADRDHRFLEESQMEKVLDRRRLKAS